LRAWAPAERVANEQPSPLARYLFAACTLLIAYASLHPLSGWKAAGVDPFAFLLAPKPRFVVPLEVAANLVGYMPFGLLAVLALYPYRTKARAVVAAAGAAIALSFVLETLQSYLPSRTPSNLDFAANSAGGVLGALLGASLTEFVMVRAGLKELRYVLFRRGRHIDAGLVLLGLWLFMQLDPQTLLFGGGDLRPLLQDLPGELHEAEVFIRAEALVAGANTIAVGLLISLLAAEHVRSIAVCTILLALGVHALAYGLFFGVEDALNWVTPGAWLGLGSGLVIALASAALPGGARRAFCAIAIMAAALIVNIAPANPYLADVLSTWQQGYFAHFVGLTRLISALWPFFALAYVVSLAPRR
jgi:VanZ family protein